MNEQTVQVQKSRWRNTILAGAILLLIVTAGAAVAVRREYYNNLKPLSNSEQSQIITIPLGSTPREIADILEEKKIIRKAWAFEWYVRNSGARDKLQAGTYALKPSQPVSEIVNALTHGKIDTDLVTVFPARRIDEVRDSLINQGFDAKKVDAALDPAVYANHPALVDKPKDADLEGYLYPESFQKTASTVPRDIVTASLDQMHKNLTPDIRAGFVRQGLTSHQGIILASIVEQEVGNRDPQKDLEDKKMVAQVFLSRLSRGIALESDATASYGAIKDGQPPTPGYKSSYNTYQNKGLTPGPISNVGKNSLLAVASPAATDYLYFVAGKDCVTRFSRTLAEHESLQQQFGVGCGNRR